MFSLTLYSKCSVAYTYIIHNNQLDYISLYYLMKIKFIFLILKKKKKENSFFFF